MDTGEAHRATIYRRERSTRRMLALALGGLALIVIAVVLALSLRSSGGGSPNGQGSSSATAGRGAGSAHRGGGSVEPRALRVVVLNATQTNGLAAKVASNLKSRGYTQAAALFGTPSGSYTTTTIRYAEGHRREADGVAQALSVASADVKPLDGATAPLSGGAPVVVIVGGTSGGGTQEGAASESGQPSGGEGEAGGETAGGGEATSAAQATEPGA